MKACNHPNKEGEGENWAMFVALQELEKMDKGDTIGFMHKDKHFTIERDE